MRRGWVIAGCIAVEACGGPIDEPLADSTSGDGSSSSESGAEDTTTAIGSDGSTHASTEGSTSSDASSSDGEPDVCSAWPTPQRPLPEPLAIEIGGQAGWEHDEGHAYGYFHTFDALRACDAAAPRKAHVLLPRGYADDERRYPVLFMNDGNTTFWPGGAANKSWRVAEGLSGLDDCDVEPVIVVALHPIDREVEYTHAPGGGTGCCGAQAYVDGLADCIKPFVDAHYRTVPDASATGIAGSSHGGLAAFLAGTLRPDAFGRVIAMSSSFWVPPGPGALNESALVALAEPTLLDPAVRPSIWIDWGLVREGGVHNSVIEAMATDRGREMAALLELSYGYTPGENLFVVEDPLGGHDEDAWAARFGPAMQAMFPPQR